MEKCADAIETCFHLHNAQLVGINHIRTVYAPTIESGRGWKVSCSLINGGMIRSASSTSKRKCVNEENRGKGWNDRQLDGGQRIK
jgi:hypothetical protein